ncbi:MAG: transposase [Candidatus Micrarchaeia archaeon]
MQYHTIHIGYVLSLKLCPLRQRETGNCNKRKGFLQVICAKRPRVRKKWSIERVFSRLKGVFGLPENRFAGIEKVTVHIYSCLIAYLIKYL